MGKNRYKVLLVDDEASVLRVLDVLFSTDYETLSASSGPEAIAMAKTHNDIAVAVLDIKMPGMDGIEAGREIRKINPDISIIFHTGYPGEFDQDKLEKTEKPYDYIEKGRSSTQLLRSARNAVRTYALEKGIAASDSTETTFGIIGRSQQIQHVRQMVKRATASDTKVMILGETGTGKELVARAIHTHSTRRAKKLGILNCNHKNPEIIESELFGHTKGAFTDAVDRTGLFEYADGGTVFLDEIGDLDITTQAKLLRVLEGGEYQKIGTSELKTCDVRILCATHRNLEEMVSKDSFRQDLFFRLQGVTITVPPLRERREDIPVLAEAFCDRFTIEEGLPPRIFDKSALNIMMEYDWPGNVRQLLNIVELLIVLTDSELITDHDVQKHLGRSPFSGDGNVRTLSVRMKEFERTIILQALQETSFNISAAAALLGVDRANLHKKIKNYQITFPD